MIASIRDNARLAIAGMFGRPYGIFDLIADYDSRYANSSVVVNFNPASKKSEDQLVQKEKIAA